MSILVAVRSDLNYLKPHLLIYVIERIVETIGETGPVGRQFPDQKQTCNSRLSSGKK